MAQLEDLKDFVSEATEVVEFKLVRSRDDIGNDKINFHPEMAHQIFGDEEQIFGYKDIKITIMYIAGPLYSYVDVKYNNRIENIPTGCDFKADNVTAMILETFPENSFSKTLDDFLCKMEKEQKTFVPPGEKLTEFTITNDEGQKRYFEIYCDDFRNSSFFSRLQTFVLWFIDAASYLDLDDMQWMYFACFEKYKDEDNEHRYATVGYTTVYRYFAYPNYIRPRISQILVLPPFRKMGIGTKFIETIYKYFEGDKKILDITVEDPSIEFTRLRNFIDAKLCKNLPEFSPEKLKNGFSKEMSQVAKQKFKINEQQSKKVYEVLRLLYTNLDDVEEYKKYRLDVKKRLYWNFFKQIKQNDLTPDTRNERLQTLDNNYKSLEEEYLKVVEKLQNLDEDEE